MAGVGEWLSTGQDLLDRWPGAADEADEFTLEALLAAARTQCEAFAPKLGWDEPVPAHYLMAQAMQARALWRAQKVGSGDQIGGDGMTVTVFPMDWTVKALLRPKKGVPTVR